MEKLIKRHADKIRFGLVGIINTGIDFTVLGILVSLGLSSIFSNYISTSVALCFSFFANKKFTFKDSGDNSAKKIVSFLTVTLVGLWVIQPIIIFLVTQLTQSFNSYISLFIGKFIATIASLIWNYVLYKKFVFLKER